MTICPKCRYERTARDNNTLAGLCPQCGIAYAKWQANKNVTPPAPESLTIQPYLSFWQKLRCHFMSIPNSVDEFSFWGRVVLASLFGLWGISFIASGIDWEEIGGSFLHNVNLPFHEFGHVLFIPFGRFMTILGGSLFQILMPLIALAVFSFQQKDNFAASIMLWWCGQNFIDVAPYINDAPYRALPLIMGMGEDAHDWGNLLTMTGHLDSAQALAKTSYLLGCILIITAMVWASCLLYKMKKQLEDER